MLIVIISDNVLFYDASSLNGAVWSRLSVCSQTKSGTDWTRRPSDMRTALMPVFLHLFNPTGLRLDILQTSLWFQLAEIWNLLQINHNKHYAGFYFCHNYVIILIDLKIRPERCIHELVGTSAFIRYVVTKLNPQEQASMDDLKRIMLSCLSDWHLTKIKLSTLLTMMDYCSGARYKSLQDYLKKMKVMSAWEKGNQSKNWW